MSISYFTQLHTDSDYISCDPSHAGPLGVYTHYIHGVLHRWLFMGGNHFDDTCNASLACAFNMFVCHVRIGVCGSMGGVGYSLIFKIECRQLYNWVAMEQCH